MTRAKVVPIDAKTYVDAKAIAAIYKRTPQWVNKLARAGKIRWHGVMSGVRNCRLYDPEEVREDLAHEREVPLASA